MTEALLFVSVGSLLTVGAATFTIAALTLRNARRYVELAEERMEYLREGQARLLVFLIEERQSLKEELEQEREQHLETRQEGEGRRTRREAERRIDDLKRELLELRTIPRNREATQRSPSSLLERPSGDNMPGTREPVKTSPTEETQRAGRMPQTASSPGTPPEDTRPRVAVWHPHPDDDVSPARASAEQAAGPSAAPVEMFRRHYDKYLENYEGYVKLAERIYRMQDNAEAAHGSLAEREWEERLRRVNDGIKRTTARLDILEEYNPGLATDDRISRRANIARSHSELERSR
ncbi:MAG: hypothetical protein LC781_21505 [Actinobacteria bacterium]|nr:hypothetical protein [Actinomycetota bacterium]